MTAIHTIFAALSAEDAIILNVDFQMSSVSFSNIGCVNIPVAVVTSIPLTFQEKLSATAVQLNSATALMETLTARGGMVISIKRKQ